MISVPSHQFRVDIPVRVRLETAVSRCVEGAHITAFDIKAIACGRDGRSTEVGILSAYRGIYPEFGATLRSPEACAIHALSEFDELSYDAGRALEDVLGCRGKFCASITRELQAHDVAAICYLERIAVHPAARKLGIGIAMIHELRALMAGCPTLTMLKAVPIDTPYDADDACDFTRGERQSDRCGSRALQGYYRSDRKLGFSRPMRSSKEGLMVAVWGRPIITQIFDLETNLPEEIFA